MTTTNSITKAINEKVSKMSLDDEKMFSWIGDKDVRKTYISAVSTYKAHIKHMLEENNHLVELKEEEIVSIFFAKGLDVFENEEHYEKDYIEILQNYGIRDALTMFAKGIEKPVLYSVYERLCKWAFERRHNPTERSRIKKVEPMTRTLTILYNHRDSQDEDEKDDIQG